MRQTLSRALRAALAAMAFAAASVQAYPIDVKADLGGMSLQITTEDQPEIAILLIRNDDSRTALCDAESVNGPQLPVRRNVQVAAGQSQTIGLRVQRTVTRLDVKLACRPDPQEKSDQKGGGTPNSK